MKKASALGALLLAGTFVMPLAASAATVLTAKNGMTVYVFDKDEGGKPTCYDACGQKWPPYIAESGGKMEEGWATVKRKDGRLQSTYDGKPLYFYSGDKKTRLAMASAAFGISSANNQLRPNTIVGIVQQSAGSVQLYEDVRGGRETAYQYSWGSSRKQPMLNLMLVCHLGFLSRRRLSRSPNARIRDPLGSCGSAMPIYLNC